MSLSLACPTATMVLVTDVPMFAPITIGIAVGTSRTEMHKEYDRELCTINIGSGGSRIFRWGGRPVGGALTSDMYTFRQKCMRKRKKLILLGGRTGGTPGSANDRHIVNKRIVAKIA